MGGSNTKSNLVRLTTREHYIAHLLLYHASKGCSDKKLYWKQVYSLNAFVLQKRKDLLIIPARVCERIRHEIRSYQKDQIPHNKGKSHSDEARIKMSQNHWSKNGYEHGMMGRNHSKESKNAMSINSSKHLYSAISPHGKTYSTRSISEMINIIDTNNDTIRKFVNTNKPIPKSIRPNQQSIYRQNAVGWIIYKEVISPTYP